MKHTGDDVDWASEWDRTEGIVYLNHGSFGRAPRTVLQAQARWIGELQRDPVDFYTRRLDSLLDSAAARMASFVGCRPGDLVFVPNATVAMNIVAGNFPLEAGDEVLLNQHEYGAVQRIWRERTALAGARVVVARVPEPLTSPDEIVDALFSSITSRTRLIVVSHVTSPTALVFPVEAICARAKALGIAVCIDGPHALAMRPLNLETLGCDYYCVSCHKWLAAPIGSGWLYVRGGLKNSLRPSIVSWGRSLSGRPSTWKDEFHWPGTFDPSAWLATSSAIEFLERVGLTAFRSWTHELAQFARQRLIEKADGEPLSPDSADWYGSMVTVRLPWARPKEGAPVMAHPIQKALWDADRIEVPFFELGSHVHLRVSCHLYTRRDDIENLASALVRIRTTGH
jgi:isopenicillin-N epimerase